ncbi:MAG: hypothetical protein KKD35_06370 [Elusimicrobia bacterium]|nr:hypothetical protein [Elusimicrobiota bacterium]
MPGVVTRHYVHQTTKAMPGVVSTSYAHQTTKTMRRVPAFGGTFPVSRIAG